MFFINTNLLQLEGGATVQTGPTYEQVTYLPGENAFLDPGKPPCSLSGGEEWLSIYPLTLVSESLRGVCPQASEKWVLVNSLPCRAEHLHFLSNLRGEQFWKTWSPILAPPHPSADKGQDPGKHPISGCLTVCNCASALLRSTCSLLKNGESLFLEKQVGDKPLSVYPRTSALSTFGIVFANPLIPH